MSPESSDSLDTQRMLQSTMDLPDRLSDAVDASRGVEGLPSRDRIENVVVIGMGDSGATGDALAAVASSIVPVPITVVKNYELPAFVGESSLVFAISHSGDTEETIECATVAAVQGASVVSITGPGELAALSRSWGAPTVEVPADLVRGAALGWLTIPAVVILEEIGLFVGAKQWLDLAIEQVVRRRDEVSSGQSAVAEIARAIGRTIPVIHGGGAVGATAAMHWKDQINLNAKSPAFWGAYPEIAHNEVAGWGQHGDITRQTMTLVQLRHDNEHPQIARRFAVAEPMLREVVNAVIEVQAGGDGELAQLLDLVIMGDFVSLQMAAQEGIDPGPAPAIDEMKAALSAS